MLRWQQLDRTINHIKVKFFDNAPFTDASNNTLELENSITYRRFSTVVRSSRRITGTLLAGVVRRQMFKRKRRHDEDSDESDETFSNECFGKKGGRCSKRTMVEFDQNIQRYENISADQRIKEGNRVIIGTGAAEQKYMETFIT